MSYLNTQNALLTKLINSEIVPSADISFENKSFNPTGKTLWLAVDFLPATDEMLGKNSGSRNQQEGIFQISVFIEKNADDFNVTLLTTIDSLLSEFSYNSQASLNGQVVDILTSTVNEGSENESWHKRDISINYLTFTSR